MADCTANPNDPICQSFYGTTSLADRWRAALTRNGGVIFVPDTMPTGGATPPAGDQSPISPDKIVTTTSVASFWSRVPTVVKIAGAATLAFIGYRALKK